MKKSQNKLVYIASIILLNICLVCIFNSYIKNNEQKTILLFNKTLEEKSLQIAAIVNLVEAHISTQDTFTKKSMERHTEALKASLNNGIFDLANFMITNKEGFVLLTSVPQSDTSPISLAHRDYFKAALNSPNKIHIGNIVHGIVSKRESIPFAKVVYLKNGKEFLLTGAGLDIVKIINSINSKSFVHIMPSLSNSNSKDYPETIEFPNIFDGNRQLHYKIELEHNQAFYTAAAITFLPLNILLVLLIIMRLHSNSIKREIYIRIQKLFPDEFKNSVAMDNKQSAFAAIMNTLKHVGNKIEDYKGNMHQVGEAIEENIRDNKLNSIEMMYIEQEILAMLSDSEIDLNAEYKSSIIEMKEEAKDISKTSNIVLSSLGQAIKEIPIGKRELTLKDIIEVSKVHFHIATTPDIERSFWVLRDLFLDRIDSIRQFLTNVCDPSSLNMSITAKNTNEVVIQYKGTIDENKSKLETVNIRNYLLHYKLKCLNKLNGIEYEAKDTKTHWLLTITLKS